MKIYLSNTRKKTEFISIIFFFSFLIVATIGCKKFVDIDSPPNKVTSDNVYTVDATAIAVLTGIYTRMSSNDYQFITGTNSVSVYAGLSSDELTLAGNTGTNFVRIYTNRLTNQDYYPWKGIYSCLVTVNTAIEHLNNSNSLSPSVKKQLLGEAKFLRAFCYFYLVNLYGDVPLALTADYRTTANLGRTSKSDVYQQIIKDLKDGQDLLSNNYVSGTLLNTTTERVRPTKWAATALLARVYLYLGYWADAEAQATSIINNNSIFSLSTPTNAFLKASLGNKEAIWQLQPVLSGWNTEDAKAFILNSQPGGNTKPVYLDTLLVKSFESGDARRMNWTKDTVFAGKTYSYPTKYKIATANASINEYLMVLRLGEQYLIRAEARAQQNNSNGAIDDLDKIRQRAALPLIAVTNPGITKSALLNTILHERQVELFTEWGHRWFDLKRTNNIDAVMSVVTPLKGGVWSPNWALYPIPSDDLQFDLNLTQNAGY
jgi:hypothetical protein